MRRIFVTGGAGFIGSALVRRLVLDEAFEVLNLDKLTYAGGRAALETANYRPNHTFVHADVSDEDTVRGVFARFEPDAVLHLAAESHVDRSIAAPRDFVVTNVLGTFTLLRVALDYWEARTAAQRRSFRLLHVSTDEVYGDAGEAGRFTELSSYRPSSPYAASKAGADHLVNSWHHTYGLPTLNTNCSNNYGPYQFPEKFIPNMIAHALAGLPLPVYGDGTNVRDWIHVDDHVDALLTVLRSGNPGETYAIGGECERRNIDLAEGIRAALEELPESPLRGHSCPPVQFVQDRLGHDSRYAIDASKIRSALGWKPSRRIDAGLRETVRWYLANVHWWSPLVRPDIGMRLPHPASQAT